MRKVKSTKIQKLGFMKLVLKQCLYKRYFKIEHAYIEEHYGLEAPTIRRILRDCKVMGIVLNFHSFEKEFTIYSDLYEAK